MLLNERNCAKAHTHRQTCWFQSRDYQLSLTSTVYSTNDFYKYSVNNVTLRGG